MGRYECVNEAKAKATSNDDCIKGAAASMASQQKTSFASCKSEELITSRAKKLQDFLVLKAFNARKEAETSISQQFSFLKRLDPAHISTPFLDVHELCDYLKVPAIRKLLVYQVFKVQADGRIDFCTFIEFLESVHATSSLPPCPNPSLLTNQNQSSELASFPGMELTCFKPSLLSKHLRSDAPLGPPPAPGLWKKREITIQERITEYTKVDEHGVPQLLVEKEKHQVEVIHMESLNGEFAHREITHFEQLEQLNGEIVHHDSGREEFLHLKSKDDEISKFESSMPPRNEECEQAPPSPTIKRDPSAPAFSFTASGGEEDDSRRRMSIPEEGEEEFEYLSNQNGGYVGERMVLEENDEEIRSTNENQPVYYDDDEQYQ